MWLLSSLRALWGRVPPISVGGLCASIWCVLVFISILWVWGLDPKATTSPDEALNRQAAGLVAKRGKPFLPLPFADPEDLAHPRSWVSVGDHALPAYAPFSIYWYALWLRLGKVGHLLISAFPAVSAGAFVLGLTRLLPSNRHWLALLAPLLASPALYWLARPWMNLSLLLSCICWAFFCWASWRRDADVKYLDWAVVCVGAAAAVRPDCAAYLFLAALACGLAAGTRYAKRVGLLVLASGTVAVSINLVLNTLTTGRALVAAYQIEVARAEGGEAQGSVGLLGLLTQLLVPMGIPSPKTALHFLAKYWLDLGNVAGLLLAQLALIPLLLRQRPLARTLYGFALLVLLGFMLSRIDPHLHGASDRDSMLHHSIPRYWTPVYLLAAVPPVVLVGGFSRRFAASAGALFLILVALAGAYDISLGSKWSLVELRAFQTRSAELVESLRAPIPKGAMVYTETQDKLLWRAWRLGTLDEPEPSAASIARAVEAKLDVFVFEPALRHREQLQLDRALGRRGLGLVRRGPRGLWRVVSEP